VGWTQGKEVSATILGRIAMLMLVALFHGCDKSDAPSRPDSGGHGQSSEPAANDSKSVPATDSTARPKGPSGVYEFHGPRDVLAAGNYTVDIMTEDFSPRQLELGNRMQQAVAKDPNWWLGMVKSAEPGKPLPYDHRMGLTRDEYAEFLKLAENIKSAKVGQAVLAIAEPREGVFVLRGKGSLSHLEGVEIDLTNDLVRTPFGIAKEKSDIDAPKRTALGAWTGVQWKYETPDENGIIGTGTLIKLAVGILKGSGRCVLYYRASRITSESVTGHHDVLVFDALRR
jgi:hypothetical protein